MVYVIIILMIKGFIFDIDDTLYYRKLHLVPESTYNALKQLRDKGYKIAVCTARERQKLKTVPRKLMELVDFVVVGSGAMAYKDHYLYWSNLIDQDDLSKYLDYIKSKDLTYSYTDKYGKTYFFGHLNEKEVRRVLDWQGSLPLMRPLQYDDQIVNLEVRGAKEDFDYLISVNPKIKPIIWNTSCFISAENVDKVTGIDLFCDAYGFNRDEICAFGDGSFDASMILEAGIGVAMKGSKLADMNVADHVTDKTILDGGIYETLVKLGFIERQIPDIKIFFFDIDQTSFDHSIYDVRDSTILALQKLRQNNIKRCICTSRSFDEMRNLPKKLLDNMDGIITCAGAMTVFGDMKIAKVLAREHVKTALKIFDANDITYRHVLSDGVGYLNRYDEEKEAEFMKLYEMIPEVRECQEDDEVIHILYYCEDDILIAKIRSLLKQCSHIKFRVSNEIMAKDTDKSLDMIKLAEALGYNKENIGAFGDSYNDVDMLKRAQLGISLGNGKEITRLSADYVTDDITDDGLYNALVTYGYIK